MKSWILVGFLASFYFLAAFSTVRDNTFVIDDQGLIQEGIKNLTHPSTLLDADYAGRKQIAAVLLLGVTHAFFGMNPFPYHLLLLELHTAIFLLIIFLGLKMGLDRRGAGIGALFFLVLGIHFQAIAWIGNITRVFMTFFLLLGFLSFVRFRKTGSKGALIRLLIFWILALQSSPDAVVFPVLLLGYDLMILKQNVFSKRNRKALWFYAALAFGGALYLASQLVFYSGLHFVDGLTSGHFQWKKRIMGTLWALVNLFIPRREILQYGMEPTQLHRILVPSLVFLPLPWLVYRSRHLWKDSNFRPFVLFSFFWFVTSFLPFVALNRTAPWKEFPPARYFYVPLIGFSFLVGKFAEIFLDTVAKLKSRPLRSLGWAWLALAGIYFYAVNVSTFCFMADKLDRTWRVKGVGIDQRPADSE